MVNCQFENHENNEIIAVCVNPGCSQKILVCFECIKEHHSTHNKDLKQLTSLKLLKNTQSQIYDEFHNHCTLIQSYINQFKQFLSTMQTDQNIQFENLNYKQLELDIQKLCSFEKVKDQIQNTIKEISKYIISLFPSFKSAFEMLNNMKQEEQKLIQSTQLTLKFSQQYKNNNIIIENTGKLAKSNSPQLYKNHFVVCEPMIPKMGCFSFSFKIGGWVMIGVCDKEKIQQLQYIAQFEQPHGHGCYFIENDGTSYSSLKRDKDCQKVFTYTEHEVISVLIDMDKKIIQWNKPKNKESFEMKIDTSKDLYPCLGLGQAWVEII